MLFHDCRDWACFFLYVGGLIIGGEVIALIYQAPAPPQAARGVAAARRCGNAQLPASAPENEDGIKRSIGLENAPNN